MSLHYLLDGYNILKQVAAFNNLPLEEGRHALLKWIEAARPHGAARNRVTVVFDGHPDYYKAVSAGPFQVIFTSGCSADDLIKSMVEEDEDRKNCVIVSDDKEIYLYARSLGAQVMKVKVFVSKRVAPQVRHDPDVKHISLTSQAKINKELGRLWLKEDQ